MNPYTAERLAQERITEFRAQAARHRPAGNAGRAIRRRTSWALIQIGLALVTSATRRGHGAVRTELP